MQKIQGRCLCGAVRYRSDAAPLLTAICNCKNCQRQTGTAFSILVAVPKGALIMEGAQPDTYQDVGDSGLPVLLKVRVANIHGRRTHSDDGLAQGWNFG